MASTFFIKKKAILQSRKVRKFSQKKSVDSGEMDTLKQPFCFFILEYDYHFYLYNNLVHCDET